MHGGKACMHTQGLAKVHGEWKGKVVQGAKGENQVQNRGFATPPYPAPSRAPYPPSSKDMPPPYDAPPTLLTPSQVITFLKKCDF